MTPSNNITQLSGEYYGIKADGGGHGIEALMDGSKPSLTYIVMTKPGKFKQFGIDLPEGNWEIIGKADAITEDQAKEVVEWYEDSNDSSYDPMYNVTTYFNVYKDYVDGDDFDTALESFHSLLKSKNLSIETTLIIKLLYNGKNNNAGKQG